ncbi:hypothetical protein KAFR_0B02120 [Kazachstania africana CBS 2517]|uniref:Uncharacterized protein n=1 Tax=Kazachstania africana (strain ATCC 22294 / BCRC 22015 / CBS 2517 / CECT 1963 / NBRC 1671 / NRRL Y-8276) TaxID=1071382 RepID=H2AQ60_KAZAF|nr:hypothetical protein KAFR_0B02120 [Kazachstania africana CBS 2517]CCF56510.1 hypothetical protein KAFR_0B02120 [Kazachstania africana CBS 2517]
MSELNNLLRQINESLSATSESIKNLKAVYNEEGRDESKLKFLENFENTNEKVSLLSLKNGSMLSYVNALLLLIANKLNDRNDEDDEEFDPVVQKTIENRIVMERGIRPIENKLSYQLDKLIRAFLRMEKEYNDAEKRALEKSLQNNVSDEEEQDSASDSDEEEEEMAYRPGMIKSKSSGDGKGEVEDNSQETDTYKPPKISAMLPPESITSRHFEDKFNAREHKDRSNLSRMQAMEEYIKEQSDQPDWGSSIGSNIVDHGRGGVKSSRDTEKERKIQQYEEDNFTRLNGSVMGATKQERRKKKQRERMAKVNVIGGEDFSIFNSKRKLEDSTSRRNNKKPKSAWDRAKKRL